MLNNADFVVTEPQPTKPFEFQSFAVLANDRTDQVAFSFLKHLACYAVGRSLTYNELMDLQEQAVQLQATDYHMKDLIRFVIKSDAFLKK